MAPPDPSKHGADDPAQRLIPRQRRLGPEQRRDLVGISESDAADSRAVARMLEWRERG